MSKALFRNLMLACSAMGCSVSLPVLSYAQGVAVADEQQTPEAILTAIRRLPILSDAAALESLTTFDRYADALLSTAVARKENRIDPVLDRRTRRIIGLKSDPRADLYDPVFVAGLEYGRVCAILDALENVADYAPAAALAQLAYSQTKEPARRELLAAVAARNVWLASSAKVPETYKQFSDLARRAENENVARQAALWNEAVTGAASLESLILANQIWRTINYDLGRRDTSFSLANLNAEVVQQVYARVMASNEQESIKGQQAGKVLRIAAVAGFQQQEGELVKWSLEQLDKTPGVEAEDAENVRMQWGHFWFSHDRLETASEIYEAILFSGIPADVAAEAGYRLAVCKHHQRDEVAAQATLQAVKEIYPERQLINRAIDKTLDEFQRLEHAVSPEKVSQYLNTEYSARIQLAQIRLENNLRQAGIHKPEERAALQPESRQQDETSASTAQPQTEKQVSSIN